MNPATVRTLARDARSRMAGVSFASGTSRRMRAIASSALARERAGRSNSAPRRATSRAASYPMPELAPVIRTQRPCWDGISFGGNARLLFIGIVEVCLRWYPMARPHRRAAQGLCHFSAPAPSPPPCQSRRLRERTAGRSPIRPATPQEREGGEHVPCARNLGCAVSTCVWRRNRS
jgi:hypothetical protein